MRSPSAPGKMIRTRADMSALLGEAAQDVVEVGIAQTIRE